MTPPLDPDFLSPLGARIMPAYTADEQQFIHAAGAVLADYAQAQASRFDEQDRAALIAGMWAERETATVKA